MTVSIGTIGLGLLGRMECDHYTAFDDAEIVAGVDVAEKARDSSRSNWIDWYALFRISREMTTSGGSPRPSAEDFGSVGAIGFYFGLIDSLASCS